MKTKNTQNANAFLLAAFLLTTVVTALSPSEARAADEAVDMIVELITGSDDDMRMMAIQQIREAAPGKDATKRFVDLMPKLQPEMQAKLIDALGTRGDVVARPAIIKMLDSKTPAIRTAAAGALAALASPDDIPALAKLAANGSDAEKKTARITLRKLTGDKMNTAMIAALKDAEPKTKIELITALTDRNVKASVPTILKSLNNPDETLRIACLIALRAMGDEAQTTVLVKHLKAAKDSSERKHTALTLLAVCRRGKAKCASAVIAGLDGADAQMRILLMRILSEAGGPKALDEIVARMTDADKNVSASALRTLIGWPDRDAIPHLKKLAGDVKNLKMHVLAIRGIVRLGTAGPNRPADLAILTEAMGLSTRREEKALVLGAMGGIPTLESLTLTAICLDKPELAEDAGAAAVMIAEKLPPADKPKAKTTMQKVTATVKNEKTIDRAKKLLAAL